jgi:hypothetical protein
MSKKYAGRLGGLKGGHARAESLTPEQRKEIARKAAEARWSKGSKERAAWPVEEIFRRLFYKVHGEKSRRKSGIHHTHKFTPLSRNESI